MFFLLHVKKSKRVYISRPIILEMTWYTYRHLDIDLCLSLNQYSHHIIDFALSCDVKSSYTILRRQKQLIAIYIIVQLHVHLDVFDDMKLVHVGQHTSSCMLTWALASISILITSTFSLYVAIIRGVQPLCVQVRCKTNCNMRMSMDL